VNGRGRFITFEGIDGAGKSTQIDFVAAWLRARGIDAVVTREPGGTEIGEALRELVLRKPMSARTETLLVFAARAQHVEQVIAPALATGRWIVCDRFTDATYAYQSGGRGVPEETIAALEHWVHPDLQPDLTFLFDIAPEIAAQRLSAARPADRFEAEQLEFFVRVRAVYLERARRFATRFVVLDGTQPADMVRARLIEALSRWC
jgi:dTMP kinase